MYYLTSRKNRLYKQCVFCLCLLCIHLNLQANPNHINFTQGCSSGPRLTIAAVGDVLLHRPLQIKGQKSDFKSLWLETIPFFEQSDIVFANLEGPIAENVMTNGQELTANQSAKNVYTGYPLFNFPPRLARDLKDSGFDVVSFANNHAMDRGTLGLNKTLQILKKNNIQVTGARSTEFGFKGYSLVRRDDFTIAWLACAEHTNGIKDPYNQIVSCYHKADQKWLMNQIQSLKTKVDAIIVSPHWGLQYRSHPTRQQKRFAAKLLEAGAIAVIGSHPHVLQPIKKFKTQDGRVGLIAYSLGNFVSNQGSQKNRTSMILLLGLTKTKQGTIINGFKYVPLFMQNRQGLDNIHVSVVKNPSDAYGILPGKNVLLSRSVSTRTCP